MTGFNLPPGCSVRDIPGCGDESCEICRAPVDDCICPECPVCGEHGFPLCYEKGDLKLSPEQAYSAAWYEAHEEKWLREEEARGVFDELSLADKAAEAEELERAWPERLRK